MRKLFLTLSLILLAAWAFADFPGSGSPISDGMGFPTSRISDYGGFPGSPIVASWQNYGLMFYAPFDDPASPLKLIRGTGTLSFTRAHDATHTATYVHPGTGLVTVASADQLRIEAAGALIEGARTNIILRSQQFDNTDVWAFWGAASVTAGIVSPAGDNTAFQLDMPNANTGIHASVSTTAATYAASIWIRADSAGTIRFFNGAGGGFDNTINVTTIWQRYSTVAAEDGVNGQFGIYRNNAGQLSRVYIWGAQWEVAAFASSDLPSTTAEVTRNVDVLTAQTSGNIDNVDGTLALQWTPRFASTDNVVTATLFDAGGIRATYTSADRKINLTDGTNTVSSAALTFSANVAQKLAFRWGPSGLLVYRDGTEAATGATYTAGAINANIYIGTDTSSANSAYSNIKSLRIWNYEMPAANMGVITQ